MALPEAQRRVALRRPSYGLCLLLTLVLTVLCSSGHAANYFISQSQGNDANAGTSQAFAWRTLGKLLSVNLLPGDTISLKRGDLWRETLIVQKSGTQNNPIHYKAYGTGAAPIISGADLYDAISALGNNRYRVLTGAPVEVFVLAGKAGRRVASVEALSVTGDWFYADGAVTFVAQSAPSSVECATRQFGIVMNEVRDLRFTGLNVRHAWDPVWAYNTQRVTFELIRVDDGAGFAAIFMAANVPGFGSDNVISECILASMRGSAGSLSFGNNGAGVFVFGTGLSNNNRIASTLVSDSGHEGIAVLNGSGHVITGNTVIGSASSGIRVAGPQSSGNIVERNDVSGNCHGQDDRFGIDLLDTGNDNIVRYNFVHEQEEVPGGEFKSGGIRFDGGDFSISENQTSTGNVGYYNVVYDEYVGINCFNVSNVALFNNTVIDCTGYAIAIHAVSTEVPANNSAINNVVRMQKEVLFYENAVSGSIVEHNVYEANGGAYYFSNGFHDFETWQSVRGFDTNGTEGPLHLENPQSLNFRLTALSPAVDAGTPTTASVDFAGIPVPQGGIVDAGAYELVPLLLPEGEPTEGAGEEGESPEGEGVDEEGEPIEGEVSEGEIAEGEGEGEPVEGEGASEEGEPSEGEVSEGEAVEGEGAAEEGEGEPLKAFHTADANKNLKLSLSEVLRVVQLFTLGELQCAPLSEDGFASGNALRDCTPHCADYAPQDWHISFLELLRVMQLFNAGSYQPSLSGEDGFLPVL